MTKKEIMEVLDEAGIDYPEDALKAELEALLPEEEEEKVDKPEEVKTPKVSLFIVGRLPDQKFEVFPEDKLPEGYLKITYAMPKGEARDIAWRQQKKHELALKGFGKQQLKAE